MATKEGSDKGTKAAASAERRAFLHKLREPCGTCGNTFGAHGAAPPHDRGEECPGFASATPPAGDPR